MCLQNLETQKVFFVEKPLIKQNCFFLTESKTNWNTNLETFKGFLIIQKLEHLICSRVWYVKETTWIKPKSIKTQFWWVFYLFSLNLVNWVVGP